MSSFNARFLERGVSKGSMTGSLNQNSGAQLSLHDSNDSLYYDGGEEEEKKTKVKKGEPSFNQAGALEMLMSPAAKKKPSVSKKRSSKSSASTKAATTTMMLPKTMTIKTKKECNMSSKVASTLDKLGGEPRKVSSNRSLKSNEGEKEKPISTNAMWDSLGKGSAHGGLKHRRNKSNPIPDLTDEIGFIVAADSPEALGSSSHRGSNASNEIPRTSRRGRRQGSSMHQRDGPSEAAKNPSTRRRSSNRRRLDGSSHRQNSLRASSSHGDMQSAARQNITRQNAGSPRTMRRRLGTPTTPGSSLEMSQSAHAASDTPARRRMRRRGSGSMGPSIDMPFNSPNEGAKEAVNASGFLSPSKGVMDTPPEGGRRQVMRGRRSKSLRGGELRSSQHGQAGKARNSSGGRRRRSRDPAAVNAGVR